MYSLDNTGSNSEGRLADIEAEYYSVPEPLEEEDNEDEYEEN